MSPSPSFQAPQLASFLPLLHSEAAPEGGRLVVEQVLGRSVVTSARGHGPLRLLTPKNHGHAAWVYQSTLGGGFVGADALTLDVRVGAGATAFLSSQAAGKVYRGTDCRFTLDARVEAGATLVNWPDPTMLFTGSRLTQRQRFDLADGASLVCVDACTAGRVATGERWATEQLELHLEVSCAGRAVFADGVTLSQRHGPVVERLGGINALATVVLAGPAFEQAIEGLERDVTSTPLERLPAPLVVASRWPWGLVLRVGAASAPALQTTLDGLLRPLVVAALGDDPLARKR
ncbi:MAG: urease accessory protein UreD [Myxococcaceae bacterium]|nr:urease accessory protein UreD [Myxococcaceae bacterium]